jgi:hypothetical protein
MSLLISRAVIDRVRGTRPPRALGAAHQLRICVTPAEIPMSRTTTAATTSIHVRDCPAAASFRRPVQFRHDSRVGIGPVRGFGRSAPELSEPNGALGRRGHIGTDALVLMPARNGSSKDRIHGMSGTSNQMRLPSPGSGSTPQAWASWSTIMSPRPPGSSGPGVCCRGVSGDSSVTLTRTRPLVRTSTWMKSLSAWRTAFVTSSLTRRSATCFCSGVSDSSSCAATRSRASWGACLVAGRRCVAGSATESSGPPDARLSCRASFPSTPSAIPNGRTRPNRPSWTQLEYVAGAARR